MDYFLFFAAVWGLSAGIAFSKLTRPIIDALASVGEKHPIAKFFAQLLGCPMCTGWHFGWLGVFLSLAPGPHTPLHAATLACVCAGINLLLAVTVERISP